MSSPSENTPVFDLLREQLSVARFYTKLLSEVLQLKATRVIFKQDGDTLLGVLSSGAQELKILKLSGTWLAPIKRYFLRRPSILTNITDEIALDAREFSTTSLVRIPGRVVEFSVTQEERLKDGVRIVLDNFRSHSIRAVFERLGFSKEQAQVLEHFSDSGKGTCYFATPAHASRRDLVAMLEGVFGGMTIDFSSWNSQIANLAADTLIFLLIPGDDIEVARQQYLREPVPNPNVAAIAAGALIARVCERCARVMVPERRLVDQIPDVLQPISFARYRIGLGCDECNHIGTLGQLFIGSIILLQEVDAPQLKNGSAIAYLRERGAVSLLEDGIKKATSGVATVQAVLAVTSNIPAHHKALLKAPIKTQREPALNIAEDFFVASPQKVAAEPLRGRSALRGPEEQSGALFPEAISSGKRANRTKSLILIVEDDPDQRSILEMIFKSADYEVAVARDGQEALDFLLAQVPDLVISDLMMPRIDGGELVRRMKSDKRFARIPVLMLTVVSDVEKEYQLLDLGADDYCEKTIQRKILLKRVANLLKRSN